LDWLEGHLRMKILLPILTAIALCGCALNAAEEAPPAPPVAAKPAYTQVLVAGPVATPQERAACEAAGGSIAQAGMMGREHCLQTYPDAGQACRDDADCLGTCRYEGPSVPPETAVTGVCQSVDVPFGCYAMVQQGKLGFALCVD
jgi:hypothetical protein